MFLDASRFSFAQRLAARVETFRAEALALTTADFVPWPKHAAYTGHWTLFPLLLHEPPAELHAIDCEANRRRCPRTWRCLQDLERVRVACFSWLGPRSHIHAHTDAYHHGLIRSHLGVIVPPQSLLRVGDEVRSMEPGLLAVLDGQTLHESANLSARPRITLLVDFEMTADEADYVAAASPGRRRARELFAPDRPTLAPP